MTETVLLYFDHVSCGYVDIDAFLCKTLNATELLK